MVQAWLGYYQSLRPCETGLTLNVDLACTAFLSEQQTTKFLAAAAGLYDVTDLARMNDRQHAKAKAAISGLEVRPQAQDIGFRGTARKLELTLTGDCVDFEAYFVPPLALI